MLIGSKREKDPENKPISNAQIPANLNNFRQKTKATNNGEHWMTRGRKGNRENSQSALRVPPTNTRIRKFK